MHLRHLAAGGLAATLLLVAGCSGSSLDTSTGQTGDTITVGLIWPQSGPYKTIGDDQAKGWQLYLDQHAGKLGGHLIKTSTGDEATSAATALTAAKKLLDADAATVLVGTASGEANAAVADLAVQKKVPFIGAGGRASVIHNVTYVWNTSWLSNELGKAIAPYLKQTIHGSVYTIGPNYQGGWDNVNGFTDAYTAAGGTLANPGGKTTWTPFPATTNFLPYLNKIKDSGAKAVFTFYAGTTAVDFVKQYQQANLGIPLYASGFLTEGGVLAAQGPAAEGVYTVLNYAPNLDNPANRDFVTLYQRKYGTVPNIYAVSGWDAGLVLDQAITAAGAQPTSASINTAIGKLGAIPSPRGDWRFGGQHSPNQAYYLRRVQTDGRTQANVVQQTLTTLTN
ncbi:ABC transporter substrate-binding protein [Actinoplanes sp. NPDC026619]|uniref:ABC transporter substrate-binding protein n=1 Tax=Actinoplanes sp. NPDC026619 TaxID=3155798 RepID=UPI0033F7F74A